MNAETITTQPAAPKFLPELIRLTEGTQVPFACIDRSQYLSWIAALSDLLICAGSEMHHQTAEKTVADAAYLLYELTDVVQAFDDCEQRARRAA